MAPAKDWLASFIQQEIAGIVTWKQQQHARQRIGPLKADETLDVRFSDDGSNFYSFVKSEHLPTDTRVQVVKILSTGHGEATAVISDGFTRVKAVLSTSVVTALEAELGEDITEETKGDVLAIREAIVVSTPLGPPEGFVHLRINQVEYQHLLRKIYAQVKAIEERELVRRQIDYDLTAILQRQYAFEEGAETDRIDLVEGSGVGDAATSKRNENHPTLSQRSSQPSSFTQGAIATQIPASRKLQMPTLAEDGLEIEHGINLQNPHGPGFGSPTHRLPARVRIEPVRLDSKTSSILNLLGKRKAQDPPPVARHATKSPLMRSPAVHEAQSVVPSSPVALPLPPRQQAAPPQQGPSPAGGGEQGSSAPSPPAPVAASSHSNNLNTSSVNAARNFNRIHKRQRIPRNQQKLLNELSSWVPSLPGKRFPHPNVPVELLRIWNEQASALPTHQAIPTPAIDRVGTIAKQSVVEQPQESVESLSVSSSSSESDDEEMPLSGWHSSPMQRKDRLPPDSTMESNSGLLATESRALTPPPDTPHLGKTVRYGISPSIISQGRGVEEDSSSPVAPRSATRTPRPLPPKPHWSDVTHEPVHADQSTSSQIRPLLRYSAVSSKLSEMPPSPRRLLAAARNEEASEDDSEERLIQRSQESSPDFNPAAQVREASSKAKARPKGAVTVNRGHFEASPTERNNQIVIDATPTSIVKATQFNKAGEAAAADQDMHMEMSIPRTLEQDPVAIHRRIRREHFAEARDRRRREWLAQNFVPRPKSKYRFSKLYKAFKKAHPKDNISGSTLSEIIMDTFPETLQGIGLKLKRASQEESVQSTPHHSIFPSPTADQQETGKVARAAEGEPWIAGEEEEESNEGRATFAQDGVRKTLMNRRALFSPFAGPQSSPIAEIATRSDRTTPGSGRRLPWADDVRVSPADDDRHGQSRSVVGRTPSRPPSAKRNHQIEVAPAQSTGNQVVDGGHAQGKTTAKEAILRKNVLGDDGSKFAEFARGWNNIRPGGAFVDANCASRKRATMARQLDVLGWRL